MEKSREYQTTDNSFRLSKAIKQRYFYTVYSAYTNDNCFTNGEINIEKGHYYWYNESLDKYVEVENTDESRQEIINIFGDDFDEEYYNKVLELVKALES